MIRINIAILVMFIISAKSVGQTPAGLKQIIFSMIVTDTRAPVSSLTEQVFLTGLAMQEGTNTISLKGGKGTLTLLKKGDMFSNVIYTDATGKTSRLLPKQGLKPLCAYPIPESGFGTEQTALLFVCWTSPAAGPAGPYNITVVLPGVLRKA